MPFLSDKSYNQLKKDVTDTQTELIEVTRKYRNSQRRYQELLLKLGLMGIKVEIKPEVTIPAHMLVKRLK
jgi:hypothetical protein